MNTDGAVGIGSVDPTRRAFLAKAGLGAAAGAGIVAIAQPDDALASTVTGWINVQDDPYFAGTGAHSDDAPWIQLAIDNAVSQGSVVFFPPGTYKIGSTLLMRSNTHLKGSGQLKSKLLATSQLTKDKTMIINEGLNNGGQNSNIVIEDLEIDGNKSGRPSGAPLGHLIAFRGSFPVGEPCRQIHLRRLYGHDSPQMGFTLQSCSDSEIVDCEIAKCDRDGADFWWNSQNCRMAFNYIHECKDDFIAINAKDVDADRSYTLTDITVVGNVLGGAGSGPGNGIRVAGAKRVTIAGNVIFESWANGIVLNCGNSNPVEDISITGNVIKDAGHGGTQGSGIKIDQADGNQFPGARADVTRVVIADNVITTPKDHCISITGVEPGKRVAAIAITNNVIERPGIHGISIESLGTGGIEVADVSVDGNTLIGNDAPSSTDASLGIICNAPAIPVRRLSISNNRVRAWRFSGVSLMGPNHFNHSIIGNTLMDNGIRGGSGSGLNLKSIDGLTVVGNRSRGNKLAGLTLQDTVTETLVCGNDLSGNLDKGINLANTTGDTLITGNLVAGNTNGGIQRSNLNNSTYVFQNVGDVTPNAAVLQHLSTTASMTAQSVPQAGAGTRQVAVPVSGASIGDTVAVGYASSGTPSTGVPAGISVSGAVTAGGAGGTVTVTFSNGTGAPITVPAGTLRADVWKH